MGRVLVVDDHPEIRALFQLVFELEGYEVRTACDGLEALEVLTHTNEPWVVLLDMAMPRMTGTQLCAHLLADPSALPHSILLMTAGCLPAGETPPPARTILSKPIDLDLLLQLVAELAEPQTGAPPQHEMPATSPTAQARSGRRADAYQAHAPAA